MFERYTENAKRAVFIARSEACALGSSHITSDHLLFGLLREGSRINQASNLAPVAASLRASVEARQQKGKSQSATIRLPFDHSCKHILAYAEEEAERAGSAWIGSTHLLMGILRVEDLPAANDLKGRGFDLDAIRLSLPNESEPPRQVPDEIARDYRPEIVYLPTPTESLSDKTILLAALMLFAGFLIGYLFAGGR